MVSNNESSKATAKLIACFGNYVLVNKLGRMTGADGGYIINGEDYMSDAAFIFYKRQPVRPKKVGKTPSRLTWQLRSCRQETQRKRLLLKSPTTWQSVLWLADLDTKTIDV